MRRSLIAVLIGGLAGIAAGQTATTSSGASGTGTASGGATTYTVVVGKGDHTFRPDVVQANVGDTVLFQFFPANHSIVRSEYGYPCIPYEMTGKGKVGFFSGFHPVDAILDNPPTWGVKINDSNPIFYYCSAPDACTKYGMTAVINPNASVSLQRQKDLAMQAKYQLNPGDPFPAEGTASVSSSATASSTSSATSAATTSATAAAAGSKHGGLPAGAIAGIVVGAVAIIALAAGLFFFMGRTKTLKETVNRQSLAPSMVGTFSSGPGNMSPAPPPPEIPQAFAAGDTIYVPVKAADLHRTSLPPYQNNGMGAMGMQPGSPGHPHHMSYQSDFSQHQRLSSNPSPAPAEMYAPQPKAD